MKINLRTLLIAGLGYAGSSHAQTTDPSVVASAGRTASAGSLVVAYTIGEPMTQQFNGSNLILTQGFHQPVKGFTGISEHFNPSVQVYPNPTADEVKVILPENPGEYTIEVYNAQGKIIRRIVSGENEQTISLKEEAAASYYLRIQGAYLDNHYTIVKSN